MSLVPTKPSLINWVRFTRYVDELPQLRNLVWSIGIQTKNFYRQAQKCGSVTIWKRTGMVATWPSRGV